MHDCNFDWYKELMRGIFEEDLEEELYMAKKVKLNEWFPEIPSIAEKFKQKHHGEEHTVEEWRELWEEFWDSIAGRR